MTAVTPSIIGHEVRDHRRAALGYSFGLALMVVWILAMYPSIKDALPDYLDAMPEAMKSMFGVETMASIGGFLHAEILSAMGPIIVLAFAITAGSGAVAGEEQEGTLLLVTSTPVGRRNVYLSKLVALLVDVAIIGAVTFASIALGLLIVGGGIPLVNVVAAVVQLVALGALFATLAMAVGAATGRRSVAVGVAVGIAAVTYLLDTLGGFLDWLHRLQPLSPFEWYMGNSPLTNGFSPGGLAALVICTVIIAIAGAIRFDRRDLGV